LDPSGGWRHVAHENSHAQQFRQIAEHRGGIDYRTLTTGLSDLEDLGTELVNGKHCDHVRGRQLHEQAAPTTTTDDQDTLTSAGIVEPATIDVWIDSDTGVPCRLVQIEKVQQNGHITTVVTTMDVESVNQPVDLPQPPADAPPLP
jgi:hypothetical protein